MRRLDLLSPPGAEPAQERLLPAVRGEGQGQAGEGRSRARLRRRSEVVGMAHWVQGTHRRRPGQGDQPPAALLRGPDAQARRLDRQRGRGGLHPVDARGQDRDDGPGLEVLLGPDPGPEEGAGGARAAAARVRPPEGHHLGRSADQRHAAEARVAEPRLRGRRGGPGRQGGAVPRGRDREARDDRRPAFRRTDFLASGPISSSSSATTRRS